MSDNRKLKNYDALPLVLNVSDIQRIMGILRVSAYGLVHTPGSLAFLFRSSSRMEMGGYFRAEKFMKVVELSRIAGRICMKKLSKYEKETIVNFNEEESGASIFAFNEELKRRLAEFSHKYSLLCRLERTALEGSVTCVLDKSRLSIRLVQPYSGERRIAARDYAKEHGFQPVQGVQEIA